MQCLYSENCSDLFCIDGISQKLEHQNLKERFYTVQNHAIQHQLTILLKFCNIITSTMPHSMITERAVSHYNQFRTAHRLSTALQTVNDRLMIALNGCGTANFDPRPALAKFFTMKNRRTSEPKTHLFKDRDFMKTFFRQ